MFHKLKIPYIFYEFLKIFGFFHPCFINWKIPLYFTKLKKKVWIFSPCFINWKIEKCWTFFQGLKFHFKKCMDFFGMFEKLFWTLTLLPKIVLPRKMVAFPLVSSLMYWTFFQGLNFHFKNLYTWNFS